MAMQNLAAAVWQKERYTYIYIRREGGDKQGGKRNKVMQHCVRIIFSFIFFFVFIINRSS